MRRRVGGRRAGGDEDRRARLFLANFSAHADGRAPRGWIDPEGVASGKVSREPRLLGHLPHRPRASASAVGVLRDVTEKRCAEMSADAAQTATKVGELEQQQD